MKIITQELTGEKDIIFENDDGPQAVTLVLDNGDKFTLYECLPGVLEVRAVQDKRSHALRLRIEPQVANTILVSGEPI